MITFPGIAVDWSPDKSLCLKFRFQKWERRKKCAENSFFFSAWAKLFFSTNFGVSKLAKKQELSSGKMEQQKGLDKISWTEEEEKQTFFQACKSCLILIPPPKNTSSLTTTGSSSVSATATIRVGNLSLV